MDETLSTVFDTCSSLFFEASIVRNVTLMPNEILCLLIRSYDNSIHDLKIQFSIEFVLVAIKDDVLVIKVTV